MQAVESIDSAPATLQGGPLSLGSPFWKFFFVALFFDIGFGLYFFLINLYLAQAQFGEKAIGMVAGALTIGNVAATIPTGLLARRVGLRPMLMFCFIAAPLFAAGRILALTPGLQTAL